MSKILYGVCGEGYGHATRSKVAIEYLLSLGHTVKIVSYDRGYELLKQYFDVELIFGLRFVYSSNELKYIETFFKNFLKTPQAVRSTDRVKEIVRQFKPDLIITDFEPISALVANLQKIPLISIDNMHILTRARVHFPLKYAHEAIVAMLVTRLMIFKAQEYIITSFFPANITEPRTIIVPPIVRREVLEQKSLHGDYIIVYVTNQVDNLSEKLGRIKCRFIIYGLKHRPKFGNIQYRDFDSDLFLHDLAGAKAVLANAGFSLISEALYLRKPYLAVPAAKQFEQVLNAYYLDKMEYGAMAEDLTTEAIEAFIARLPDYQQKLADYPAQNNHLLYAHLDAIIAKLKK